MTQLVNAVSMRDVIFFLGALAFVTIGSASLFGVASVGRLLLNLLLGFALLAALDIGYRYGIRPR